ncbi:MAG: alanine--tRNA ligase [Candidatus Omnitrophica bacterium]|nr:alanine--tRNA ligase [Candidatus Omnitrophota bacterium]
MNADALREKFLEFFKARKHKIVASDSLVPGDDPTVLFTPAGMNQFKKQFLGLVADYRRAATAQRCLRTDDLDKVGKTSGHHTFFEMLGNFSFGDYFKKEAILWAWEFLTQELKIDKERLWVSVYKDDDEAYKIWKDEAGFPAQKILKLGDKENFWPSQAKQKGPNGPCGPCSEIFFDRGKELGCGEAVCDPSCDCGRFVEVWNLVFTQFNRKEGGALEPLPQKNIDTGMGLERLAAVMQGAENNFETDLFRPLIKEITSAIENNEGENKLLVYAVVDHIRAITLAIYDGILPSNEGRGYVIRKLIRKSVLHLRALGINSPFLNRLVPLVALVMHVPYPDLKDKQEDIALVILNEESNFIKILECSDDILESNEKSALERIEEDLQTQPKGDDGVIHISSNTASSVAISVVRLYETNGIPIDISTNHFSNLIEERGLKNDPLAIADKVKDRLNNLREFSKAKSKMKGDVFDAKKLDLKLDETRFIGYEKNSAEAKILAILKGGKEVKEVLSGDKLEIVLDQTPFYAESGGQVGDTGKIINAGNVFEVLDTKKADNVFLHIGKFISGSFKKGDSVTAKINSERRLNIAKNHTATHILQAALKKVLGDHVRQQGSLVAVEKFRFDFTHFKGLSKEEIARVEEVANSYVSKGEAVNFKEMTLAEAKKIGALAFFEEKYGENVRVVGIGDISKELCGGTHLDNINNIGLIKIISESSVSSGIRRIEGVTGIFAEQFIKDQEKKTAKEARKGEQLKELKEKEKKHRLQINNSLKDAIPRLINKVVKINDINVAFSLEPGLDMNTLRLMTDKVKERLKQGVVALGSQDNEQDRAYLVVAVTQDLVSRGLDATALARQIAPTIGGSGGGRKDFAQAGGTKPENLEKAMQELKEIIAKVKL